MAESNERPNASFAFPDTALPSGGQLTVDAAASFAVPAPGDQLQVVVEVRLTDGRIAQRSVGLVRDS